jgi:hypothetical protein
VIGTRHELWENEYRKDAYTDQMGIKHDAQVIMRVAIVEIVEVRDVKGDWGGDVIKGGGWRAIDAEGREYFNNWNSFDDASMSPRSTWLGGGGRGYWMSASKYSWGGSPYIHLDGTRAVPQVLSQAPTPLDYQI